MKYTDAALLDHLASTYVLGTLGHGARRRFQRLLRERADVQLLVAQWEARLGLLASAVPPARQPPARVWAAIAKRTSPQGRAHDGGGAVVPGKGAKAGSSRYGSGGWAGAWWGREAVMLGLAGVVIGMLSTAALVAAMPTLFVSSDRAALHAGERLPQAYVGLLTDAAGDGKVLVSSLRHGRVLTIKVIGPLDAASIARAAPGVVAPSLVLWAVPAVGAPFALGTVPASGSAVSALPDTSEKLLSKVGKLMVTVEASAKPQAPSGFVLLAGNCAKLW